MLTPIKGKLRSRKFLVLDIESKDGPSQVPGFTRPFMVGVYDGSVYRPFFDDNPKKGWWQERYFSDGGCVDKAMRFILQRRYRGWHVYAHNAGKFDYLFLLPWLMRKGEQSGLSFSIIPVASAIQVLDVFKGSPLNGFKWRFLDSYRLINTSLDKAAKAFGLEGKLQHDLSLTEDDPLWVAYNRQDCIGLYRVLEKFHHYIENVLLSEVGITAPSTSIKLLRRRFLPGPLPRSVDTHEFVRAGYFGGRVEPFVRRGTKLRYYDINSSYPRAMLEPMPAGEATWWEGEPPSRFKDNLIGFANVDVYVPPSLHIPPLPVRIEERGLGVPVGKLIFPTGYLRGTWEWSELQLALELGCTIEAWRKSVWYEPVYMFEQFVRELYRYRDRSQPDFDPGMADVVKRLLNAAYGKFGMKTRRKKIYRWDDPRLPANAVPASDDVECPIWYAEEEVDAPYIMPQIAARVTSLARVQLYRVMQEAQQRGGTVYYCDTDSVITDVELSTSSDLGALKDEYPEYSGNLVGEFLGPKLYVLTAPGTDWSSVKAKGLERRTIENVERLARGETLLQRRLEKIGTLARSSFMRGPRMVVVPRTIRPEVGKRLMHEDGTTTPYCLDMRSQDH